MTRLSVTAVALALAAVPAIAADPPKKAEPTTAAAEFFEAKVRPVLVEHCFKCHGEKKQQAGLRLDSAEALKKGSDDGPVVVPGDPAKSKLLAAVRREGDNPMPPKEPLPAEAVAALTEWVKAGAPYPAARSGTTQTAPAARDHWAFRPVKDPPVPAVKAPGVTNPIDRFLLARLEEKGLTFSPPADKRTLIRRAFFDLVGLPPTYEEVEAFVTDESPDAFEKVVDRLLASPHYGERWGRYWLDIARYADSKGYVFQEDRSYPFAYTYRDYVIRSFNEDKPYDRFLIEQIAADKLSLGTDKRPLAALGFLTVGRRFMNNEHDIIDDRIDVVTRGLMGLTVACARCHDHKYDPIPQADYYSLYGVFASSVEPKELPLIGEVKHTKEYDAFQAELKKREAGLDDFRVKRHAEIVAELRTKGSIAKYLMAVHQARGKALDSPRDIARELSVRPAAFLRWRQFLADAAKKPSPVFDPWFALSKLPEKGFADAAAEVIADLGNDTKRPVNPRILAALADAEPQSLRDVAAVYGEVLASVWPQPGPVLDDQAQLLAVVGTGGPVDVPFADADRLFDRADRNKLTDIKRKIDAFKAASPVAPPRAMVLNDAPRPTEPVVFLRGNPNNRGPAVPRRFPAVVSGPDRKPFADGSGRLELAKDIASPDNPLTARVFVNRVWMEHFGKPLVRTPSDFGTRSDPPTHPELLDWLAKRFVEDGWSVKALHRRMMLSAAYQQASEDRPELAQADPENRLLGRMNRRRDDFEALRDGMLAVADKLDPAVYGRSVDLFKKPYTHRRTVYGHIDRQNLPGTFRAFDFPSPDLHSSQRPVTTVPQQALFLMNSPFVADLARAVAARPEVYWAFGPGERVRRMYRAVLARDPTAGEVALAEQFVASVSGAKPAAGQLGPWELLAQVLLMSDEFAFVD